MTPGLARDDSSSSIPQPSPRVLLVYYTFSHQTERVGEVISRTLEARGAEVTTARIELTDERWAKRFATVPMRFPLINLLGMLPAQVRQATGEIRVPPEAQEGGFDLVVIGSPTWWFRLSLPMRSYLTSASVRTVLEGTTFAGYTTSRRYWRRNLRDIKRFGQASGGRWLGGTHFVAAGNQVQSMLAWLGFMSGFTYLDHALRLPPTNLQPGFETMAQRFAEHIADKAFGVVDTQPGSAKPA